VFCFLFLAFLHMEIGHAQSKPYALSVIVATNNDGKLRYECVGKQYSGLEKLSGVLKNMAIIIQKEGFPLAVEVFISRQNNRVLNASELVQLINLFKRHKFTQIYIEGKNFKLELNLEKEIREESKVNEETKGLTIVPLEPLEPEK